MSLLLLAIGIVLLVLVPATIAVPVMLVLIVVSGIIARHVLADLAAGLTLLLARPYAAGERVRLSSRGGEVDAEVMQVRLLRTTLCTGTGVLVVRNRDLLRTSGS